MIDPCPEPALDPPEPRDYEAEERDRERWDELLGDTERDEPREREA